MTEYALVVAGGKGSRFQGPLPKQFLPLNGLPVLMHTVSAFRHYSSTIPIVLVLPAADIDTWKTLCKQHDFRYDVMIVPGGHSRFDSVRKGLNSIEGNGLVAIHDGVRPLVSPDLIDASFRLAALHGSAVAAVRLKESLRVTDQTGTQAVDRSRYRLIQTPQTFRLSMIREAYQIREDADLTDDASVAERSGHKISLFEGRYENIKITTAEDLLVAEALLKQKS